MNIKDINEKLNEILNGDIDSTKGALAKFLDVDVNDIEKMDYDYYNLPQYKIKSKDHKNEEYAVSSSKAESKQACYEDIEKTIEDMGIMHAFNWEELGGIENYLEEDWFREAWEEMNQSYINEFIYEDPDRFFSEAEAHNIDIENFEDIEDAKNALLNKLMEDLEKSGLVREYVEQFGEESLNQALEKGAKLNIDKIVDELYDFDTLSKYDGEEHLQKFNNNTYYIYRLN